MLKSMTAYGKASITRDVGRFSVEIQSLNRKYLEINFSLPRELTRFENDARRLISETVYRGQVMVKLFAQFDKTSPITVTPNMPFVHQLKKAWDEIAQELKMNDRATLDMLSKEPGVLLYGEEFANEGQYREAVLTVIAAALREFSEMREREGLALERDIEGRIDNLLQLIINIKSLSGNATSKYRQKLKERIEEVLNGSIENEERILREVALFADRVDITEEITRFESHVNQFKTMLQSELGNLGKSLEFLLQELNREINTIGSKSSDVEIARLVIDSKSEIERIREQIQNIE